MAENQGKMGRPRGRADGAAEAIARIKDFKKQRGLTQETLGELAGVGQTSVSRALKQQDPVFTPALTGLLHYVESQEGRSDPSLAVSQIRSEEAASRLQKAAMDAWDGTQAGLEKLIRLLQELKGFRGKRRSGVLAAKS